jgi:hypothetical protein
MSKTPVYIQQVSTLNAVTPLVESNIQQQNQLSTIITDLTNLINKVNIHERQISTLVSGTT